MVAGALSAPHASVETTQYHVSKYACQPSAMSSFTVVCTPETAWLIYESTVYGKDPP